MVVISEAIIKVLRLAFVLVVAAGCLRYVALSLHGPMIWDTPIIRYVNFLIDKGMKPYGQITDLNMPGAYLAERWAMWSFGASDLGCRLYEFFQLALLAVAAIIIAGRRLWFAGIYASGFFVLMHASEGPLLATERDELIMVLIVAGLALFLASMRLRVPYLMAPFGAMLGLAAAIKPTVAPLELLLLVLAAVELRRRDEPWLGSVIWSLAGTGAIFGVVLRFLLRHHAIASLLFLLRVVLPTYTALRHPGMGYLLRQLLPLPVLLVLPFGLAAMVSMRSWRGWEERAIALGLATGLLSYLAQGKGFVYHRYLFLFLLLIFVGKGLAASLAAEEQRTRTIGALGVAVTLFLVLPFYVFLIPYAQRAGAHEAELARTLEGDLRVLGVTRLDGKVQCFDLVSGCLNALYHLRLVQRTGFTGDLLLFSPANNRAARYYRQLYWDTTRNDPPEVVVLGNEWFGGEYRSFDKVETWPDFATYLRDRYTLVQSRGFSPQLTASSGTHPEVPAYRIYLLKGSALLQNR